MATSTVNTLDAQNLSHWNQASKQYAKANKLFLPERRFLDTYRPGLRSGALLDLGIGAGRTTMHFAPVCGHYVGIDYAPAMIEQARLNCADYAENLVVADACDLAQFADASFEFVLFSFNGLDCLDPHQRVLALNEVYRVLKPGGLFSFSTHNLDSVPMAHRWPAPPLNLAHPAQTAYRLAQRAWRNRRIRPLVRAWNAAEVDQRGWACFPDGGESYEVPLFYASIEFQRKQLLQSGLRLISVQDRDCREIPVTSGRSADSWLYYLAERRL